MVHYTLFGKPIVFDDGAERFFDLQYQSWTARDQAIEEFSKWYQSCGNIGAVLAQYRKFGGDLVEKFALKPLFSTLLDNGIFDVSQESYRAACLDTTDINEALRRIQSQYQQIERTQAAEEEYRQARKDNRGRWQGGGFGLGGALKGAAEAGALNMVSGLGHSMVNAVGNAGSAAAAASSKQALFKNQGTAETLFQGIESSLRTAYQAHMELVNRRKGAGYIRSTFDFDRSAALFENAKKLPERREELLVQAVTLPSMPTGAIPMESGFQARGTEIPMQRRSTIRCFATADQKHRLIEQKPAETFSAGFSILKRRDPCKLLFLKYRPVFKTCRIAARPFGRPGLSCPGQETFSTWPASGMRVFPLPPPPTRRPGVNSGRFAMIPRSKWPPSQTQMPRRECPCGFSPPSAGR